MKSAMGRAFGQLPRGVQIGLGIIQLIIIIVCIGVLYLGAYWAGTLHAKGEYMWLVAVVMAIPASIITNFWLEGGFAKWRSDYEIWKINKDLGDQK